MKTQYPGTCKLCGAIWKVGDDIFYQKDPKCICSDEECYTQQGGKPFVPSKKEDSTEQTTLGGGQAKLSSLEQKMSNAGALDAQLANITMKRLTDMEEKFGKIDVPEKLIFFESWARTLAMSLK